MGLAQLDELLPSAVADVLRNVSLKGCYYFVWPVVNPFPLELQVRHLLAAGRFSFSVSAAAASLFSLEFSPPPAVAQLPLISPL